MSKNYRYFQIVLLVLAAGSIYVIPYIRTVFATSFMEEFGLSSAEISGLYSVLGLMFLFGYFPSGILADRFGCKRLIVLSLFVTASLGWYLSTIPSASQLVYIFIALGVSTVFTFWSALIKSVKLLSTESEQANVFGFLDGGRGVVEALLTAVAIKVYSLSLGGIGIGISGVFLFYCFWLLLIGVLILIFFKEPDCSEPVSDIFSLSEFVKVVKNKRIWLLCFIIYTGYTLYWCIFSISQFLVVKYEFDPLVAASIVSLMLWMRPIGGIGSGFVSSRFGREFTLGICMVVAALLVVLIAFSSFSSTIMITVLCCLFGLLVFSIRGIYWSLLDKCNVSELGLGLAIGFVSFVGYLPDFISSSFQSFLAINYEMFQFEIYFVFSALIGVSGVIGCLIFKRLK